MSHEIRDYLLGQLDEPEQLAFEERILFEDGLAAATAAEERDLLDAWVQDELPVGEREALEGGLLRTPTGRERLEVAQTLWLQEQRDMAVSTPRRVYPLDRWWLAAASLLLVVGASWWLQDARGKKTPIKVELLALDSRDGEAPPKIRLAREVRSLKIRVDLSVWPGAGPFSISLIGPSGAALFQTPSDQPIPRGTKDRLILTVEAPEPLVPGRYLLQVTAEDGGDSRKLSFDLTR